jgi:DNA gyrase subunit A
VVNLLKLDKGESIVAAIATKEFPEDEFLMFGTKEGMVKKTAMSLYDRTRQDGLIAINLREGDELIAVKRVKPGEKVAMVSSAGKAISWDESEVRAMGRDTMGVRGMTVPDGVHVLGLEIASPGKEIFVITERGYGKRTPVEEYPLHHRGGQGVFTITMTAKKGQLAAMKVVTPEDALMIISEEGVVMRTSVSDISQLGRATQGVKVMNVDGKDRVSAVAIAPDGKRKKRPKDSGDMEVSEADLED